MSMSFHGAKLRLYLHCLTYMVIYLIQMLELMHSNLKCWSLVIRRSMRALKDDELLSIYIYMLHSLQEMLKKLDFNGCANTIYVKLSFMYLS